MNNLPQLGGGWTLACRISWCHISEGPSMPSAHLEPQQLPSHPKGACRFPPVHFVKRIWTKESQNNVQWAPPSTTHDPVMKRKEYGGWGWEAKRSLDVQAFSLWRVGWWLKVQGCMLITFLSFLLPESEMDWQRPSRRTELAYSRPRRNSLLWKRHSSSQRGCVLMAACSTKTLSVIALYLVSHSCPRSVVLLSWLDHWASFSSCVLILSQWLRICAQQNICIPSIQLTHICHWILGNGKPTHWHPMFSSHLVSKGVGVSLFTSFIFRASCLALQTLNLYVLCNSIV